jgi:hypothetical protein
MELAPLLSRPPQKKRNKKEKDKNGTQQILQNFWQLYKK